MLSAVDKRCIRVGYSLYVKDKKSSISSAYDEMLRRFYSVRDISKNSEEELRLLPSLELPSLRQFRYWGQIFFDEVEAESGRKGLRKWLTDRSEERRVGKWGVGKCRSRGRT